VKVASINIGKEGIVRLPKSGRFLLSRKGFKIESFAEVEG